MTCRRIATVFVMVMISFLTISENRAAFADSVLTTIPMVDNATGNAGEAFYSAVNANTDTIYVALRVIQHQGSTPYGWVAVIDGSTNSVTNEIHLTGVPGGIATNPSTNTVYAIDANGTEVINGTTDTIVTTIHSGCSGFVATNPDTNEVYVTGTNSVCVINGTTNTVTGTIPVPVGATGIGVDAATDRVYVASQGGSTCSQSSVTVIDGSTNNVTNTISVPNCARLVSVNQASNKIYVADDSLTYVIYGATETAVPTSFSMFCVGANPNTDKVYGCDQNIAGQVDVANGIADVQTSTVPIPSTFTPYLTVNPNTDLIYVSSPMDTHTIVVIQGTTLSQDANQTAGK